MLNEFFGEPGANVVLAEFGKAMADHDLGRLDAAHLHGDENVAHGDDRAMLDRF